MTDPEFMHLDPVVPVPSAGDSVLVKRLRAALRALAVTHEGFMIREGDTEGDLFPPCESHRSQWVARIGGRVDTDTMTPDPVVGLIRVLEGMVGERG